MKVKYNQLYTEISCRPIRVPATQKTCYFAIREDSFRVFFQNNITLLTVPHSKNRLSWGFRKERDK